MPGRTTQKLMLGPPGATVRVRYSLTSRRERTFNMALGASIALLGVGAASVSPLFALLTVVGLAVFAMSARPPSMGHVVLTDDTLEIGPVSRVRVIPLGDIVETSRATTRAMPLFVEQHFWNVVFSDRSRGPYVVPGLGVAMVEPAIADELSIRVALRARALASSDARAAHALEALHEADACALGVYLDGWVWRAFTDVKELITRGETPFRDGTRIPICVRAPVLRAFEASSGELTERLEPVAVMP